MDSSESDAGRPRTSETGAFAQALHRVEPNTLSTSDRAYFRLLLLALHQSVLELTQSLDNPARMRDILSGIDLILHHAARRFAFPSVCRQANRHGSDASRWLRTMACKSDGRSLAEAILGEPATSGQDADDGTQIPNPQNQARPCRRESTDK